MQIPSGHIQQPERGDPRTELDILDFSKLPETEAPTKSKKKRERSEQDEDLLEEVPKPKAPRKSSKVAEKSQPQNSETEDTDTTKAAVKKPKKSAKPKANPMDVPRPSIEAGDDTDGTKVVKKPKKNTGNSNVKPVDLTKPVSEKGEELEISNIFGSMSNDGNPKAKVSISSQPESRTGEEADTNVPIQKTRKSSKPKSKPAQSSQPRGGTGEEPDTIKAVEDSEKTGGMRAGACLSQKPKTANAMNAPPKASPAKNAGPKPGRCLSEVTDNATTGQKSSKRLPKPAAPRDMSIEDQSHRDAVKVKSQLTRDAKTRVSQDFGVDYRSLPDSATSVDQAAWERASALQTAARNPVQDMQQPVQMTPPPAQMVRPMAQMMSQSSQVAPPPSQGVPRQTTSIKDLLDKAEKNGMGYRSKTNWKSGKPPPAPIVPEVKSAQSGNDQRSPTMQSAQSRDDQRSPTMQPAQSRDDQRSPTIQSAQSRNAEILRRLVPQDDGQLNGLQSSSSPSQHTPKQLNARIHSLPLSSTPKEASGSVRGRKRSRTASGGPSTLPPSLGTPDEDGQPSHKKMRRESISSQTSSQPVSRLPGNKVRTHPPAPNMRRDSTTSTMSQTPNQSARMRASSGSMHSPLVQQSLDSGEQARRTSSGHPLSSSGRSSGSFGSYQPPTTPSRQARVLSSGHAHGAMDLGRERTPSQSFEEAVRPVLFGDHATQSQLNGAGAGNTHRRQPSQSPYFNGGGGTAGGPPIYQQTQQQSQGSPLQSQTLRSDLKLPSSGVDQDALRQYQATLNDAQNADFLKGPRPMQQPQNNAPVQQTPGVPDMMNSSSMPQGYSYHAGPGGFQNGRPSVSPAPPSPFDSAGSVTSQRTPVFSNMQLGVADHGPILRPPQQRNPSAHGYGQVSPGRAQLLQPPQRRHGSTSGQTPLLRPPQQRRPSVPGAGYAQPAMPPSYPAARSQNNPGSSNYQQSNGPPAYDPQYLSRPPIMRSASQQPSPGQSQGQYQNQFPGFQQLHQSVGPRTPRTFTEGLMPPSMGTGQMNTQMQHQGHAPQMGQGGPQQSGSGSAAPTMSTSHPVGCRCPRCA